MNEMSKRLDYPLADLLERLERAELQGQDFAAAGAKLRQQRDEASAAAYLASLQALCQELEQIQWELGLGTAQGIANFWRELTAVVTGQEQALP